MAISWRATGFWRLRHKAQPDTQPATLTMERRRAPRLAKELPMRLRLGPDLFPGRSYNVSSGGIGLGLDSQDIAIDGMALQMVSHFDAANTLVSALTNHERGALELLVDNAHSVVRVRIASVQRTVSGARVGLAIDDGTEAERLSQRLQSYELEAGRRHRSR